MRIIKEINHPACKITLYAWNNRYIIKLEDELLEQTFKVNEFDVTSETEIEKLVDNTFLQEAMQRFGQMQRSLREALQRS
jgi:NADP-dependent 3-hydroxy acid dehydrogenase YdfG